MKPTVPLLDLRAQFQSIRDEVWTALEQVVESQQFILGPEVAGLENEIAQYCGTTCAVGCASGSDALLLILKAIGIGTGDEVITTPYSFFATASAIKRLGARPVFVDIDPDTYNIDPQAVDDAVTPNTAAILPVHLYGQMADMPRLLDIATRYGLATIEDACQAIGAEQDGHRAGSMGLASAFSFFPSKNLGGFGDGGMITTNDTCLSSQMKILRVHGMEPKYHHRMVGYNARLDAIQAAVLRVKLRHLESWHDARRSNAQCYAQQFRDHGLDGGIRIPRQCPGMRHVFNQYVIRVSSEWRDALRRHLSDCGVGTEVYYPVPLHLQECFRGLGYKVGQFPNAEAAARETIALPIYPELTEAQRTHVVESIAEFASGFRTQRTRLAA